MSAATITLGLLQQVGGRFRQREKDWHAAFERMMAESWPRFFRYALRLCHGDPDQAEDLLSESMIDAFRAFESYRGTGFDSWVFRMITNNYYDMLRRARVRQADSLETAYTDEDGGSAALEVPDLRAAPERQVIQRLLARDIQSAIDALPPDFRIVVLLCDLEGMDYQQIAETLDIPIGTVRSRLHRGRGLLRRTLEADGWDGA